MSWKPKPTGHRYLSYSHIMAIELEYIQLKNKKFWVLVMKKKPFFLFNVTAIYQISPIQKFASRWCHFLLRLGIFQHDQNISNQMVKCLALKKVYQIFYLLINQSSESTLAATWETRKTSSSLYPTEDVHYILSMLSVYPYNRNCGQSNQETQHPSNSFVAIDSYDLTRATQPLR